MAGLLLNDLPVLEATMSLPRVGAWTADVSVHSEDDIAGAVVLADTDGKIAWHGTVVSMSRQNDTVRLRISPGNGGLSGLAKPKHYGATTVSVVLKELLAKAGEKLAANASPAGHRLTAWTQSSQTIGAAIAGLLEREAKLAWRFNPDGGFWCGAEVWATSSLADDEWDVLGRDGETHSISYRLAAPNLLPGTILAGDKLGHAEIRLSSTGFTATAWTDNGGGSPVRDALTKAVRGSVPELDYLALYAAQVVKQSSDGLRVDVQPDDPRIPPMSGVPLWVGVPGARVLFNARTRVLVGWSGGSQAKPYVTAWDQAETVTRLSLVAARVNLGSAAAADPVVKASELIPLLQQLCTLLATLAVAPVGATLPEVPYVVLHDTSLKLIALSAQLTSIASGRVFVDI